MSYAALGFLRRQYLCILRRCAWYNALAVCGSLVLPGTGALADSIVADGRTQTQVAVSGAVTNITTQTLRGNNAYNSFSKFNVDTGNTVNLHLPGQTSNLLNLVHGERSYINGLVNAYKGGSIGGNVYFFNPYGVVVGAGGVINVGSLTMSTPTTQFMDRLINPSGSIDDAATAQALAGQMPLSPTGLVRVEGRIHATQDVTLAGGNVEVSTGAQVLAGAKAQVAFANLVNVDSLVTASGVQVDGGTVRILAAQDIKVAGQVSADGLGAHSNGGTVYVMAGHDATLLTGGKVSANAGTVGNGGFVEFSAKDTVVLAGGGLQARAEQGRAGDILIDPPNLTINADLLRGVDGNANGITWDAGSLALQADKNLTIDGALVSTRQVSGDTRADHIGGASTGSSGNLSLSAKQIEIKNGAQLLAHADNGFSAGDITIAATDNQSTPAFAALDSSIATILIDHATIRGGNVSIQATANDKWVWTGNEYGDKVLSFLDDLRLGLNVSYSYAWAHVDVLNGSSIDAVGTLDVGAVAKADATMRVLSTLVGVGYGETDANAKVNIGIATLGADGAMTLRAEADSNLLVGVDTVNTGKFNNPASNASQYADFAFAIGKGKQVAEAIVGTNATISRADSLTVEATGEKSQSVASSGGAYKDGTASAGVSVSISDTTLTARLGGSVNADQVTVKAALADDASTEVSASAGTAGSPDFQEAITSAKPVDEILFEKLSDFVAKAPTTDERSGNSAKLGVAAAFAWVENTNAVTAEVAPNAHVLTPGGLDVLAVAKESISFETSAAVDERDLAKKAEGDSKTTEDKKKIAVSASVLVLDMQHHAEARIGDGAVISAGGPVNVNAQTAIVPFYQQWPELIAKFRNMDWSSGSAWYDLGQALYGTLGDPVGASTWSQTAVESEKLALAGALEFLTLDNKATAKIGDVSINVGTAPITASQDVTVSASASQGTLSLVGVPEWDPTSPPGTNTSTGTAGFGGSYLQFFLAGGSEAVIAQGADLRADDVAVLADTGFDVISVTETVGKAGKVSINGAFSLLDTDVHTIAQIGAAGVLTANDVLVHAQDDSLMINVAGGVARSESVGIGFSVAINELDREVRALIGNRATETGVGGTLTASGNLLLNADADGTLGAVTVAGSGPAGGDDTKAKGGDGKKTNVKDKGEQGKSGVGISGAASVNQINDITVAELKDLSKVMIFGPGASALAVDKDADGTTDETVSLARGLVVRARNDSLAIAGAGSLTVALDKSAGLAGAFTWNELVKDTRASVSALFDDPLDTTDGKVTVVGGGVNLDAENTGALWSISASGSGGDKVGIAGSVSYSTIDNVTEAAIDNAQVDADATVVLAADDTSDIRSIAGAASYGGKAGVGTGVAISTVDSDTLARINGGSVNGDAGVSATATNDNAIFSVAAALGASKGVAVSGSVTINAITNRTEASSTGALVTASANAVNLDADDTSDILSIAGSVALSSGQASVGIAAAYNEIDNETSAIASAGTLSGSSVRIEATETATIGTYAVGGSGSAKVSVTGSLGINTIGNTTIASATGATLSATGEAKVRATDTSAIESVTGAAAFGGNGAVGAAGSYNHIGGEVKAEISAGKATAGDVLVDAERTGTLDVWAISGSGAGTAGFAGSIALNDVGGSTTARISAGTDVGATGNVLVTAEADDVIKSKAGAVGLGGNLGAAGGIAFNDIHADTLAEITGTGTQVTALGKGATASVDNGLLSAGGALFDTVTLDSRQQKDTLKGVSVVASSTDMVQNYALSAAGGGSAAVAATVSIAMLGGTTTAQVTDHAEINTGSGVPDAGQEARVAAYHHDAIKSGTGGGAVGGDAGVGGAADTAVVSHMTTAKIDSAQAQATQAVTLDAGSTTEITQAVIAVGGGTYVGLAGTVGVILLDGTTQALVNDAQMDSKGSLKVEATADADIDLKAGALAVSGIAGVGITAAVTVSEQNTKASVSGNSDLNANGATDIHAATTFAQEDYAYTAAAAGGVGIAGTANVVVVKGSTQAQVGGSVDINADTSYGGTGQDVNVTASDTTRVENKVGSLGIGLGGAGVGAVADVILIHNGASANVASGAKITADRDITVIANTVRDANSISTAMAGGYSAGIAGAASVISIGARPDGDANDNVTGSVSKAGELAAASATGDQMGSEGDASASRADSKRSGIQLSDDLDTAPDNSTAAASVASGATLTAGQNVNVTAHNNTNTDAIAVGAAVSGGVSLGGGIAIAMVEDKTIASLDGTTTAGGMVSVSATDDQPDASLLRTYAGGAGLAGLAASYAWHDKASSAQAQLGGVVIASGAVSVDASLEHNLVANGGAAALGVVGVGAAIAQIDQGSLTSAELLDNARVTASALTVSSDAQTGGTADVVAAAGGLLAGVGALADVNDNTHALAAIGDDAFIRTGSGALNLYADVNPQARAEALGVAVSAGVSIGASLAYADVKTLASASTGANADIGAGSMDVHAQTLRTGDTAAANATAGAGGLLLGASATDAAATVQAQTIAKLGDNNAITTGNELAVRALASTSANANATGINASLLLAAGSNTSKASTDTQTHVSVDDETDLVVGSLRLHAEGNDTLRAGTVSGAGGLGALIASKAETEADAATSVLLGKEADIGVTVVGGTVVADTVDIEAVQHINFDATADSTSAAAVGASGARAVNDIDSRTLAAIGQNMTVSAQDLFSARAGNDIEKSTAGASGYQVDSGSGGALNAAAARSQSDIRNDAQVSLGQDALIGVNNTALNQVLDNNGRLVNVPVNGLLEMAAWNDVAVYDRVRLDSGGAIAIARAESTIENVNIAGVSVGQDAGLLSDGNIELSARSASAVQSRAHSKTYGLAGAAEGNTRATIAADQEVQIGSGAFVEAQESVHLMAGADRTQANQLDADAETRLWNRTAVPVETDPDALGQVVQHNDVTVASGAQVRAVRDVVLTASDGVHRARGYGEGTDLYREALSAIGEFFGADTSSLKIIGGSSYDNANLSAPIGGPSSAVDIEGTVQAGIWNHQWITVAANGSITSSQALDGVATHSDGQNVAQLLQQEIDDIENAADAKLAQYNNFKGGSAAAAAIEAQASATAQVNAAQQDLTETNQVKTNVQAYVDTARSAGSSAAVAAVAAGNAAELAAAQAATNTGDSGTTAAVRVAAAAGATATAAGAASATAANTAATLAEAEANDLTQAVNATSDPAAKTYLQTMANAATNAASKARAVATAAAVQETVFADNSSTNDAKNAAVLVTANAAAAADAAAKSAAVVAANDAETTANQAVSQATSWLGSANTQLTQANADLAAAQNANGSSDAALGMYADAQFLSTQLSQLQGATNVDFVDIGASGDIITARSGNVRVTGKALIGGGDLSAPGDATIEIRNQSTRFLRVNADLLIPDEGGGQVTFNGMRVSSATDVNQRNAVGQSASVDITDAMNTAKPLILIENSNTADSGNSGGPAQLWIYGNVTNLGGEAKATSHGTLRVAGNVSAETVNLATGGDFIKNWTPGYTHQGGDPVERLGNLPNQTEAAKVNYSKYGLPDCNDVACGSTIAGNNVYISAEKLNINGLIQAGLPERGLNIDNALLAKPNADDPALTNTQAINAARATWLASPSTATRYIDLTNPTADGIADSGDIKLRYNAEFDRLELADVRMGGGHMELFGDIFSTGNGELRVMDGYGRINITNTTGYDLAVGRLDTGPGVQGTIRITDTARDLSGNYRGTGNTPLVTEITRINGVATTQTNTGAGGSMQVVATSNANDGRSTSFNPMADRRFNWINGQTTNWERIESYETKTTWGADWLGRDPGEAPISPPTSRQTYTARVSGDWLSIVTTQGADYALDYSNATSDEVKTNLPTTSRKADCFWGVCHSRIYTSSEKYSWSQYEHFHHSLNASQGVEVNFTGHDSSQVYVSTDGQLLFSGLVRGLAGDVTLNATQGMGSLNADARLLGQEINLTASAGAIGSAAAPVRIELVNDGAVTASGRDGVALTTSRGDLLIDSVMAAQGDVNLSADGHIRTTGAGTTVTGENVSLVSLNGGIHGLMDSLALQVETLGNDGALSARAVGDIRLQEATGDMRLRQVTSVTGDVYLGTPGRLLDANSVEQVDEKTSNELLALWKEMGLRGDEAKAARDRNLNVQAARLKQEYEAYFRMRNLHRLDDGSYTAEAYDPGYAYHATTAQASVLKSVNGWSDADAPGELARYESEQTAAYHAAQARFGVGDYVVNYTPTLTVAETAALSEGAIWTDAQLANGLASGLFRPVSDTDIRVEDANVIGRHVTLNAQTGIGMQRATPAVITLDANGLLSDDDKLILLTAERKDISVDGNGQVSVTQFEDVDVTVSGELNAYTTSGSALLGSETDLTIGQVSATDEVRIKTGAGIAGVVGKTHITAARAILEAGSGDLGSAITPILIELPDAELLTARAGQDMFVRELTGDMTVESVFAKGKANLAATGSIVEAVADRKLDVRGDSVSLVAGDTVGRPGGDNALDVAVDAQGRLDASAPNGVYINSTGGSGQLGDITTHGDFNLSVTDGGMKVVGQVQADASVQFGAGDDIAFVGGSVHSDGPVTIQAGLDGSGGVLGDGQGGADVVTKGDVHISAPDAIGGNAPLVVATDGELDLQGRLIDVTMQAITANQPAELRVTGLNGAMAQEVSLDIRGASETILRTLVVGNGRITSDSPNLQVRQGNLGDWVSFHTPFFNARIDHLDRTPPAGMDVRGFSLDGDFDIELTPIVAYVGAYVINQNPRRIVEGNPRGYVDQEIGESLRTQQAQPIHADAFYTGDIAAPASGSGSLVNVVSELMDDERWLEENEKGSSAP